MALDTYSYNISGSFIEDLQVILNDIASEYTTMFPANPITISLYTQGEPIESYPGVRCCFYTTDGYSYDKKRFFMGAKISVFTKELLSNPDDKTNHLIRTNILTKLNFTWLKTNPTKWKVAKNYTADPSGATAQGLKYSIEIDSNGWTDSGDPDASIRHWSINIKFKHR